jgi:hypothetical protein
MLKFSEAGGMAERLKAAVLKTAEGSRLPWVQILLPPPIFCNALLIYQFPHSMQ